jgi:hypothetical protein
MQQEPVKKNPLYTQRRNRRKPMAGRLNVRISGELERQLVEICGESKRPSEAVRELVALYVAARRSGEWYDVLKTLDKSSIKK